MAWVGAKFRRERKEPAQVAAPLEALLKKKKEIRIESTAPMDLQAPEQPKAAAPTAGPAKPPPPKEPEGSDHLKRLLEMKRKQKEKN